MRKPVLFLVGPTGSGKTQLSLCLAKRLRCEIISADSMLVYRGMDIGTAKPLPADRKKVFHDLVDIVSPRSSFSVHRHRKLVLKAIERILKRGRIPLVVGGSGLYVDALWKGLSPHPGGNSKLRKKLAQLAERKGLEFVYEELKRRDPLRAREIHPNDCQRILRSLEIAKLSKKPASEWYREKVSLEELGYSVRAFGITRDRFDLYERIDRRVGQMFRRGFLREVRRLERKGFSKTAGQALGYREVLAHFKRGEGEVTPALIQEIQQRTRQFAKRQLTWFRREKKIQWVSWGEKESVASICGKIVTEVNSW